LPEVVWQKCVNCLQEELPSQQFNTWIKPLRAETEGAELHLFAPNRFVKDWVNDKFYERISELVHEFDPQSSYSVVLDIGKPGRVNGYARAGAPGDEAPVVTDVERTAVVQRSDRSGAGEGPGQAHSHAVRRAPAPATTSSVVRQVEVEGAIKHQNYLVDHYTFDNFVEGKSNQLALAAAGQIAENPGGSYNPLFLYGGVGLGKTHLMHAVGNAMLARNPAANVAYVHSERFVGDMVRGLQHNTISEFKRAYRSLDALLIDDIQFFAGKERSQEEFFHTFNALLEGQRQIVLTCDRYPKEVNGLEERLKSRFGWGLTVAIEPPELETSVAILMSKAEAEGVALPDEVAFFIAKRIRSNVRELEGALRRVIANSRFTDRPINLDFAKEALRDLLALQARLVSIENIQKTVADYFKIRVTDLR